MNTIRLIIVAVGGQGNLLASKVLGEAALSAGVPIRMSEIHGMAQRGGVVESAIVFGDARSMLISDGEADILMGFEPSETLRALNKCNPETVVITNTSPLPPFTVNIGQGTYPDVDQIQGIIGSKTKKLVAFNGLELARKAGNTMALNMVLLGALIQSGMLPLTADQIKEAIQTKTKSAFVEINLKAFDLGFKAAGIRGYVLFKTKRHALRKKSTVDQIRERFDQDVDRFSNLATGQEATMDAPLMMDLTARAALAAAPHARHMLDIGCGAGNYTLKIIQKKADMYCDLVDLSAPMLERASQRVGAQTSGEVRTFRGDIRDVVLPRECYDIITAAAVLHHLREEADWRSVFEKLFALCAPGGSLWIVDLICHDTPAVQQIMDDRYGQYLESRGGPEYREKVTAVIDQEDSPRSLPFQLNLLLVVGFSEVEVLHKNAAYAAFGALKPA